MTTSLPKPTLPPSEAPPIEKVRSATGLEPKRSSLRVSRVPGSRPGFPRFALLVLLLLAAGEVSVLWYEHSRAAGDGDWEKAATHLATLGRKKNEPILITPDWAAPMARRALGNAYSAHFATLSDADRFERVWQLSIRGSKHPFVSSMAETPYPLEGPIAIHSYKNAPSEIVFDATKQIQRATVTVEGSKAKTCPKKDRKFQCDPAKKWNWVGQHLAEVGHKPYRCVYAHPVDNHTLKIAFPKTRVGESIVLYTGIDDFESRKRGEAPVRVQVFAGDEQLINVLHKNHWPWSRSESELSGAANQIKPIRIEVTTPSAHARTFCFHLEMRS